MSTSAMSTSAMSKCDRCKPGPPRSPDPRSPDPRGPDATVADLASAAVLGAVLWDPRRLREVMDWLEPDDFLHPVHRAIYATVTGLVAAGEPVNLMRLPAALASGRFHEVHVDPSEPGPLGAAGLHTFLAFTPATPPRGGRYDEQPRQQARRQPRPPQAAVGTARSACHPSTASSSFADPLAEHAAAVGLTTRLACCAGSGTRQRSGIG